MNVDMENTSGQDDLCQVCSKSSIPDPDPRLGTAGIQYGTCAEVAARHSCPFCRLISHLVPQALRSDESNIYIYRDSYFQDCFRIRLKSRYCGKIRRANDNITIDGGKTDYIQLDTTEIADWIKECEGLHINFDSGREETNFSDWPPSLPPIDITLIDVVEKKLVRASSGARYIV